MWTKEQQQQQPSLKVSPEQQEYRMQEANKVLQYLQSVLIEGQNPGTELVADALVKSQEILSGLLKTGNMDSQTQKTIEDIAALVLTARQLGRNKGVADRLKIIADETQKAIEESRGVDITPSAKDALDWVTNWRPLFYLITSSRDFRKLILDMTKIVRGIAYRYVFNDENEEKFVEGEPVKNIAEDIKQDVKEDVDEKGSPDMSEDEWERLQEDIQRVLCVLAKEPTYRQGIERLFNLLDLFQKSISELPTSAEPQDIHIRKAVIEQKNS
jgi:hypothetical protein